MELLYAIRDLGVADPTTDTAAEETARAALLQEITSANRSLHPSPVRRARRPLRLIVPALAVAGAAAVAVVIATASGQSTPSAGSSANPVHLQETAYVIRRVRANLAAAAQNMVVEDIETGGNGNPGSDRIATSHFYTDPQTGVQYSSSTMAMPDGTVIYAQYWVGTPTSSGMSYQETELDPVQQLYSVTTSTGAADPTTSSESDAEAIRAELASGQATQHGTATIDGRQVIKLTFTGPQDTTGTLYVDPQTYEPVRSVASSPVEADNSSAGSDSTVENWLPASAANVGTAKMDGVPADYTQVSQAKLHAANPAAR
jgi:hypothetical protein